MHWKGKGRGFFFLFVFLKMGKGWEPCYCLSPLTWHSRMKTSGKVAWLWSPCHLLHLKCINVSPRSSHLLCLLTQQVSLRDLRTFKTEHEFDAYSGSLSDFDVHGNLLAACGFSSRGLNGLSCDRFLMVYDLRMMRAVTPLQVHVDPLFLRFIPTYTSRLAIISQTGTFLPKSVVYSIDIGVGLVTIFVCVP